MRRLVKGVTGLGAAAILALALPAAPAGAHEGRSVNGNDVVVGWLEEPAFAGFLNAVQFVATRGGAPVEDARLQVEVVFGGPDGERRTDPMPLEPAFGSPGEYHATLIPTRPGRYTFHITGMMDGPVDESFTSGPETFSEIEEVTGVQFPVQDPSAGELGGAVTQIQGRLDAATAAAREARDRVGAAEAELASAEDAAGQARLLALGAAVAAAAAIVLALVRRPRGREG